MYAFYQFVYDCWKNHGWKQIVFGCFIFDLKKQKNCKKKKGEVSKREKKKSGSTGISVTDGHYEHDRLCSK